MVLFTCKIFIVSLYQQLFNNHIWMDPTISNISLLDFFILILSLKKIIFKKIFTKPGRRALPSLYLLVRVCLCDFMTKMRTLYKKQDSTVQLFTLDYKQIGFTLVWLNNLAFSGTFYFGFLLSFHLNFSDSCGLLSTLTKNYTITAGLL